VRSVEKKLRRSKREKVFLGVLGGIAEYLDLDPTVVRIGFVVLFVFAPVTMTLLYFLMALVMPPKGETHEKSLDTRINEIAYETRELFSKTSDKRNMEAIALILIVIGVAVLIKPFLPPFPFTNGETLVALLLIALGALLIMRGD